MFTRLIAVLFSCVVLSGCVVVPPVDPPQAWFTASSDLAVKAEQHRLSTWAQVNEHGLLLYDAFVPFEDGDNFAKSHDMADAPAWHGSLMAATAFEAAVTGEDPSAKLDVLANGILHMWSVTGEPGLYARSAYGYDGPRLPWMVDSKTDPTKYWQQGNNGWFRTGAAKGHLTRAVFGAGVPLALYKQGLIQLTPAVYEKLKTVVVTSVRRLAEDQYRMLDWDGKATEFGDLRPGIVPQEYIDIARPLASVLPWDISDADVDKLAHPINGFNMILVLSMLRAAGEYDPEMMQLFHDEFGAWEKNLKLSMKVLGFIISRIGHYKLDKPAYSDMELVSQAALLLKLYDGDTDATRAVGVGLNGLWSFVQFERNVPFVLTYSYYHPNAASKELVEVEEDLRAFPDGPKVAHRSNTVETSSTQPLANRKMSSHYWKSDPSEKVVGTQIPQPGHHYGGQDYLGAYWLGRYLELVPQK